MYDDKNRMYVLAHRTRDDQQKAIDEAKAAKHFVMPIRANCLELLLDGNKLVAEANERQGIEEDISIVQVLANKTRYPKQPRAVLTLTTMSPDEIGYYYSWCDLECMLDMKFLPLWIDINKLAEMEEKNE